MNTAPAQPATAEAAGPVPFHCSERRATAVNVDTRTGLRSEVVTSSRLEMQWVAGELQVRCSAGRQVITSASTASAP